MVNYIILRQYILKKIIPKTNFLGNKAQLYFLNSHISHYIVNFLIKYNMYNM